MHAARVNQYLATLAWLGVTKRPQWCYVTSPNKDKEGNSMKAAAKLFVRCHTYIFTFLAVILVGMCGHVVHMCMSIGVESVHSFMWRFVNVQNEHFGYAIKKDGEQFFWL